MTTRRPLVWNAGHLAEIPSGDALDGGTTGVTALQASLTTLTAAAVSAGAVVYATLAALNADLVHAAGTPAFVYADGTATNNGVYAKVGSSGSGSWAFSGVTLASVVSLAMLGSDVTAQLLSALFDQTSQRWVYGKSIAAGLMDTSLAMGLAITTDGYAYAKFAIKGGLNGMGFTQDSTGFWSVNLGTIQGQIPLGAGGDLIDTTQAYYIGGLQVLAGVRGASGGMGWALTTDGYLRAKFGVVQGPKNGLTWTFGSNGITTLSLGTTENQLPLGAGGEVIDTTQSRYLGGQLVPFAWQDSAGHTSLFITADGFVRGKLAVQAGAVTNGLTVTRDALGMTSIQFGTAANNLPLGAAGDVIDTTSLWYYKGVAVAFARVDANKRASYIETVDGKVYIPDFVGAATPSATLDAPLDTTNYLFTSAVVSNKLQLFRTTKLTGIGPTQITSSGNNINPALSADGTKVLYSSDRLGGRDDFYQPIAGGAEHPVFPSAGVGAAFGDSLTAGSGGGTPYTATLGPALGRVLSNGGIGSQKSTQIAMRQGGAAITLTVSGNQISSGANTVTAVNGVALAGMATNQDPDYRFISAVAGNTAYTATGTIVGIHGTLTRTGTGGPPSTSEAYSFTPDSGPGSPVSCPSGSTFTIDTAGTDDQITFLWPGRNNYTQPSTVLADVASCVAFLKPLVKKFVVMSVLNGAYGGEQSGQSGYNTLVALNASLAAAYPNNYLDVRAMLVSNYNAAIGPDVVDHTNDVPPFSLRALYTGGVVGGAMGTGDTTFTFSGLGLGQGQLVTMGTEYILINSVSGGTVTSCTRGYGGSTAITHAASAAFSATDNIHLSNAGYVLVANALAAFVNGKGW